MSSKTMARLAYHYLQVAGIVLEPGQQYDGNKLLRPLSLIYKECGKNESEAMRRITVAGEYFNSKHLSWTPYAVWRDWEMIGKWKEIEANKPKKATIDGDRAYQKNGVWYIINRDGEHKEWVGSLDAIKYEI